jgi:hypothetical protein
MGSRPLQIGFQVDLAQLKSGMGEAAAVVGSFADEMDAALGNAADASAVSTQAITDTATAAATAVAEGFDGITTQASQAQAAVSEAASGIATANSELADSFAQSAAEAPAMSAALRAAYEDVAQAAFLAKNAQDTYRDTLAANGADSITESAALDLVTDALIRQVEAAAELASAKTRLITATEEDAAAESSATEAVSAEATSMQELAESSQGATAAMFEFAEANEAVSASSSHSITDVQATSAAIRVFEMNAQGGVRAAENFIAKILGLGAAFQYIFPIVGAIALTEIVSRGVENFEKWKTAAEQAANVTEQAWEHANDTLRSSADTATASVDHLIEQRDKLLGIPGENGMVIAFDDASRSAQKLTVEIDKMLVEYQKAIIAKGTVVSGFTGFLTNQQSTGSTDKLLKDVGDQISAVERPESRNVEAAENDSSQDDKTRKANVEQASTQRLIDLQVIYASQVSRVQQAYKSAEAAQDLWLDSGKIQGTDNTAVITKLGAALDNLNLQQKVIGETYAQGELQPKVSRLQEDKGADSGVKKKQAEKERAEREADSQALAALQRTHALTNAEEIAFWQQRATIDTAGVARIDEINKHLGALAQQGFKEQAAEAKKSQDIIDKAQSFVGHEKVQADPAGTKAIDEEIKQYIALGDAEVQYTDIQNANSDALKAAQIAAELASGAITKLGAAQAEAALKTQQFYRNEIALNEQLKQQVASGNQAGAAQTRNQISQAQGGRAVQVTQDQSSQASEMAAPYMKAFEQISSGWNKTMDGILMGQTTVTRGFERLGSEMLMSMINGFAKMLERDILTNAASLVSHTQTETEKTAVTATATAQRQSVGLLASLKQAEQNAMTAATGAYSATVGIPFVGPILAPIAAAGAFTAVIGLQSLASAAGGWGQVPQDTLAMIHKNEMVLPASIAGPVRGMAASGGQRGGNTVAIHQQNTYNGVADQKTWGAMMSKNNRTLAAGMRKAQRSGRLA